MISARPLLFFSGTALVWSLTRLYRVPLLGLHTIVIVHARHKI